MLRYWLQLSLTEGIGPILSRRLIEAAGGVEAACGASQGLLQRIDGIGGAKSRLIHQSLQEAAQQVDREIELAGKLGVRLICRDDESYPILLKSIPDPPSVLYTKGTLEPRDLNGVAIVGSRRCSYYGREQAERFAALLAGSGITVISGGARGVDSAAHRGAMSHADGRTIAVLGSGLDVPYPSENAPLFEKIAQHGAVLSEYPLGTAPLAENFPRRNRIVSGMSRGVLVIEADERSGALITARQANEDHGRPVFALPGRVDNVMSAGPHLLIRDGAILVTKLEDILDELAPLPDEASQPTLFDASEQSPGLESTTKAASAALTFPAPAAAMPAGLSERQAAILTAFDGEAMNVDALVERCELPAAVVLQELTMLSLRGAVRRVDGNTYTRRKASR